MNYYSDEMLSAYANDELSIGEREEIEKHIDECADCRSRLEAFQSIRMQLAAIDEIPVPENAGEKIMASINAAEKPRTPVWWRKPLCIGVPLVLILVLLLTFQPWNSMSDTDGVIARASAAMEKVDSYRIAVTSEEHKEDGETDVHYLSLEYSAPDRYHIAQTDNDTDIEQILIGNRQYNRNSNYPGKVGSRTTFSAYASMMDSDYASVRMNTLKDITKLPDETVGGTRCRHYTGFWDEEKVLTRSWEQMEKTGYSISDAEKERKLKEARQRAEVTPVIYDLWIGKDDYLLRKMTVSFEMDTYGSQLTVLFSAFNQPVEIEAPLDVNGNLLPGWTTPTPETPNLDIGITSKTDDSNPENRKITFNVVLTNFSQEMLKDVQAYVMNGPVTSKDYIGYTWRWSTGERTDFVYTRTILPLSSAKFEITFTYDATETSPDAVDEKIRSVFVDVLYYQNDQQQIETFHLETPEDVYNTTG